MTVATSPDRRSDDENDDFSDTIESVAFLARSEHRIRVLSLLADGVRTRDEISEGVGVTRVTLSRILGDLEDREFLTHDPTDNTYELTRFGELVYRDFSRLLGTVSIGTAYPDLVERLPMNWFDFDCRYLAEGELVADDETDPMSAARVVANAVQNASERKALLGTFLSTPLYTFEEAVRDDAAPDGAVVFDADVAERMIGDADLRQRWQEIEGMAENTVYYRVDERVPCGIALMDRETVFLTVVGDQGNCVDVIKCSHPEIVTWADRTIDEYRARAKPLGRYVEDTG